MNQLLSFIRKEFLHVLRDRKTLLILFGLPIVQILLFGFALTNEVRNANIVIIDDARDVASREIIGMISASRSFRVREVQGGHSSIDEMFRSGGVKLVVLFPVNFNNDLMHAQRARVQIIADASDPNTASTLTTYVSAIIADYQKSTVQSIALPFSINTQVRMLYNPQLKGAPNFVPGVMALVLMLVCVMMTSIAIVREKELGTMEILLVSPFRPMLVIVAKVVPYLLLSLVNVATILVLSTYVLDLPVQGSVLLLFGVSTVFILTSLALGLLISTITNSQQSAMLFSMMGMLLPTVLFSGFMFPIENMPIPLQVISNLVPARWYYTIVKAVMIKGLGITSIWRELLVLVAMTVVLVVISVRKFKVRLA